MKQVITKSLAWCLLTVGLLTLSTSVNAQDIAAEFQGSFQGQLEAAQSGGHAPFGRIEFTVTKTGKTSGKITLLSKKSYSFSANLAADGENQIKATLDVVKAKTGPSPLTLTLTVDKTGTFTAVGIPLSPVAPEGVGAYRTVEDTGLKVAVFGKTTPCEWAGTYSLAFFSPSTEDSRGYPSGASYGTATVSSAGLLSVKGKLADGTSFTTTVKPSSTPSYSILVTPYKAGGALATSFTLTKTGETYSVVNTEEDSASATWVKNASPKDKLYPEGFGPLSLSVALDTWTAPAKGESLAETLGAADSQFDFDISGAGLNFETSYGGALPVKLTITEKNTLLPVYGGLDAPVSDKEWALVWSGKIDPKTGIYTATLTITDLVDTDGPTNNGPLKLVKRKITIQGILFNSDDSAVPLAYGYFLLPPLVKNELAKTGNTGLGSVFTAIGTGAPSTGGIRPGTPGNYETALGADPIVFDLEAYQGEGITIKMNGEMKGLPEAGSNIKFTIAPDLSSITFNGRKVPLVSDQRGSLDIALLFSDASPKNIKNTLTVTAYLNLTTGQVQGIAAMYTQLIPAKITFPTMTVNGRTIKGRTVSAKVPGVAIYFDNADPVKVP